MSAGTRKAIYEKLDALMRKSGEGGFGYGDELQSGDEGYLQLMDAGVIADSTGKRIPGKRDSGTMTAPRVSRGFWKRVNPSTSIKRARSTPARSSLTRGRER